MRRTYSGLVLDLSILDLEAVSTALADRTDYEHWWLINPETGEIVMWTSDTGIDGQTPVDLDELDLVGIRPLPSWVWYQDMADFAEAITDERAGRRLARAIEGKGAFRRFRDELYEEYPNLLPAGTRFAMPAPNGGPSNGWPIIRSSTTTPPSRRKKSEKSWSGWSGRAGLSARRGIGELFTVRACRRARGSL